jgi:hypothetical protein
MEKVPMLEEQYFLEIREDGSEWRIDRGEPGPGSLLVFLADGIERTMTSSWLGGTTLDYGPPVRPPGRGWEFVEDEGDMSLWERSVWKRLLFDDDEVGGAASQSKT